MADYFYYLYLRDALRDRGVSKTGIHQIENLLPLTKEEDRKILVNLITDFIKFQQRHLTSGYTNLTSAYRQKTLTDIGFSLLAVTEMSNYKAITNKNDREVLFNLLTGYFERNEDNVPSGYPGNMKH